MFDLTKKEKEIKILCAKCQLVYWDLTYIDENLKKTSITEYQFFVLLKQLFVTLSIIQEIYKKNLFNAIIKSRPEIVSEKKKQNKCMEFYNRLRNLMGGHLIDQLIGNTLQWHPELFIDKEIYRTKTRWALNLFILEAAINSYTHENGDHRIFKNEIDLVIEAGSFLKHLEEFVTMNLNIISSSLEIIYGIVDQYEIKPIFSLFTEAAKTDFRIKLKKR